MAKPPQTNPSPPSTGTADKAVADAATPGATSSAPAGDRGITVRMYCQGLGDCLLLSVSRQGDGPPFRILIDCGVILGAPNAGPAMSALVQALRDEVKNRLDVVVMTHRHWDHVSGFDQAKAIFQNFDVGEVWTSWLEDPADSMGRQILAGHAAAETALRAAAAHLDGLGATDQASQISELLSFRPRRSCGRLVDGRRGQDRARTGVGADPLLEAHRSSVAASGLGGARIRARPAAGPETAG